MEEISLSEELGHIQRNMEVALASVAKLQRALVFLNTTDERLKEIRRLIDASKEIPRQEKPQKISSFILSYLNQHGESNAKQIIEAYEEHIDNDHDRKRVQSNVSNALIRLREAKRIKSMEKAKGGRKAGFVWYIPTPEVPEVIKENEKKEFRPYNFREMDEYE
jgi:hypothetical protein